MLQCHIYDVLCYCNDVAAKYKPQNVANHMPLKVKRYAHTVYFENVLIYHSIFMSHDKKSSILRIALHCAVLLYVVFQLLSASGISHLRSQVYP